MAISSGDRPFFETGNNRVERNPSRARPHNAIIYCQRNNFMSIAKVILSPSTLVEQPAVDFIVEYGPAPVHTAALASRGWNSSTSHANLGKRRPELLSIIEERRYISVTPRVGGT